MLGIFLEACASLRLLVVFCNFEACKHFINMNKNIFVHLNWCLNSYDFLHVMSRGSVDDNAAAFWPRAGGIEPALGDSYQFFFEIPGLEAGLKSPSIDSCDV